MSRVPRPALLATALALLAATSPARAQDQEQPDTARTRQMLACEEAARLSIDRDRLISRSISGAQEPDPLSGGGGGGAGSVGSAGSFRTEMSKYDEERRRRRLIDDCAARAGAPAPGE